MCEVGGGRYEQGFILTNSRVLVAGAETTALRMQAKIVALNRFSEGWLVKP